MTLSRLHLSELRELHDRLTSLVTSRFRLEQDGLAPVFDLTPGQPIRVTLAFAMPPLSDEIPETGVPLSQQSPAAPSVDLLGPPEGAPFPPAPSSSDGDELPNDEEPSEGAVEDSGGGVAVAAAESLAALSTESARAMAFGGSVAAPAWSAEEDDRLIDLVVTFFVRQRMTKMAAINAAAGSLGRGREGVKSRCYGTLRVRLAAAIAKAEEHAVDRTAHVTASPEVSGPPPAEGDAAGEGRTPPAVQSPAIDVLAEAPPDRFEGLSGDCRAIARRVFVIAPPAGWTESDDLALMEGLFRGLGLQAIGTAIGKPFGVTQDRFLQLRRAAVGNEPLTLTAQEHLLKIVRMRAVQVAA